MVGAIKRIFRPMIKPFAVKRGAQRTVDTRFLLLDRSKFFTGLRPEEKLDLFDSIYQNNPIASGAVNSICKLINTRIIPQSDNPAIDKRMREIWQKLNLHSVNEMLIRQALIFGYSVCEYSWDDNTLEMDRMFVPQTRQVRFQTNRQGDIENIIQFPSRAFGATLSPNLIPPIPAGKFIIVQHDKTDTADFYGNSLFAAAVDQFESICKILRAQIKVFERLGSPRYMVEVENEGLTEEQYNVRLDQVRSVFQNLADGEDIFSTPGTKASIIGTESFGQKTEAESRLVISMILARIGLPPPLLSLNIQSAGAESYARQSIILLQSLLDDLQQTLADAWNNSFWRMIQILEGFPTAPKMSFHRPRLLETLMVEEGRELQFQNDMNEVVAGIRPLEWLVQKCGAKEAADPQALQAMIEQRRSKPQEDEQQSSGDKLENTKGTDEIASNNKSL